MHIHNGHTIRVEGARSRRADTLYRDEPVKQEVEETAVDGDVWASLLLLIPP